MPKKSEEGSPRKAHAIPCRESQEGFFSTDFTNLSRGPPKPLQELETLPKAVQGSYCMGLERILKTHNSL